MGLKKVKTPKAPYQFRREEPKLKIKASVIIYVEKGSQHSKFKWIHGYKATFYNETRNNILESEKKIVL